MTDTHTLVQKCYQHPKPVSILAGFKVLVVSRGKQITRYCCRECLKYLLVSAEVISFEPFAVIPISKEERKRRDKLKRERRKERRRIYAKKYYDKNFRAVDTITLGGEDDHVETTG